MSQVVVINLIHIKGMHFCEGIGLGLSVSGCGHQTFSPNPASSRSTQPEPIVCRVNENLSVKFQDRQNITATFIVEDVNKTFEVR